MPQNSFNVRIEEVVLSDEHDAPRSEDPHPLVEYLDLLGGRLSWEGVGREDGVNAAALQG
jgi:hypothetical protein